MGPSTLSRFQAPVAKGILVGLGLLLMVIAIILLIEAVAYPYLIDFYYDDLYLNKSRSIPLVCIIVNLLSTLVLVSTGVAFYKSGTNYAMIHSGLTSIIVPIIILAFFTVSGARYNPADYEEDYEWMIDDYRISASEYKQHHKDKGSDLKPKSEKEPEIERLHTFSNNIDKIQRKLMCCGVKSVENWNSHWEGYIAPSCCLEPEFKDNKTWSKIFHIPNDVENFKFAYCEEDNAFKQCCIDALNKDESRKFEYLNNLFIILIIALIANAIVALIMFGFSKSERHGELYNAASDFAMVSTSLKPRPSQPAITSIRPRPSTDGLFGDTNVNVMSNGIIVNAEQRMLHSKAQAVRFNIASSSKSGSPRPSMSGASRFSAAARRDSSFI